MGKHRTIKQRIADLELLIKEQRARIARRVRKAAHRKERAKDRAGPRFSPTWVASHRRKLGLSAEAYGKLVGVTGLTIYNWEKERARPRAAQLGRLAAVRGIGVREARGRLEGQAEKRRARKP